MAVVISVRLDDDAEQALRTLEAAGPSSSEAICSALVQAADQLRRRPQIASEAAALDADEDDREDMKSLTELMVSLRGPR